MPAAAAKPKGIAAKLAEVMGLLDAPLPKTGFNKAQTYAFVNESAVSAAIRPLLAERGIWVWSSEVEHHMEPLFKTSSGNQMWLTEVTMEFRFIDGETGETTDIQKMTGHGADTADKGLAKAQSMALKYFLLKSFMLSTGKDDNEADEKVDKAAAASTAARGARVTRTSQPGVQRGGKTDLATEVQVAEVLRLAVEQGMDAPALRPIIKETIGKEPPEGSKPREWLGTLTGKEIAALIAALQPVDGPDDNPASGLVPGGQVGGQAVDEPVEDGGQQEFAIA